MVRVLGQDALAAIRLNEHVIGGGKQLDLVVRRTGVPQRDTHAVARGLVHEHHRAARVAILVQRLPVLAHRTVDADRLQIEVLRVIGVEHQRGGDTVVGVFGQDALTAIRLDEHIIGRSEQLDRVVRRAGVPQRDAHAVVGALIDKDESPTGVAVLVEDLPVLAHRTVDANRRQIEVVAATRVQVETADNLVVRVLGQDALAAIRLHKQVVGRSEQRDAVGRRTGVAQRHTHAVARGRVHEHEGASRVAVLGHRLTILGHGAADVDRRQIDIDGPILGQRRQVAGHTSRLIEGLAIRCAAEVPRAETKVLTRVTIQRIAVTHFAAVDAAVAATGQRSATTRVKCAAVGQAGELAGPETQTLARVARQVVAVADLHAAHLPVAAPRRRPAQARVEPAAVGRAEQLPGPEAQSFAALTRQLVAVAELDGVDNTVATSRRRATRAQIEVAAVVTTAQLSGSKANALAGGIVEVRAVAHLCKIDHTVAAGRCRHRATSTVIVGRAVRGILAAGGQRTDKHPTE